MGAVAWLIAEDLSAARLSSTLTQEWSGGTSGSGASVIACPSGFGWAIAKDTSVVNNHSIIKTITGINTVGAAGYVKMGMPSGDTTWRLVCIFQQSATNNRANLEYRRSTNEYRITRDLLVAITGATFSGPADPTVAHHVAWEFERDASAGKVRAWLDGVQVLNLTGVNTGTGSHLFDRFQAVAPTGGGTGQTTHGNILMWNCISDPWDGEVKVVERLAPTSDVSVTGSWTTGSPHWSAQDDPINTLSTSSAVGAAVRMTLDDIDVSPTEIYGIVVYGRQQGTGNGRFRIYDTGGNQQTGLYTGAVVTSQYCREVFSGPSTGGDWTKTLLNGLELAIERDSGSVQFQYAHVLIVRTLEVSGVDGELDETLDDAALDSRVSVINFGNLSVSLASTTLDSTAAVPLTGQFAATIGNVLLASSAAVGAGSVVVDVGEVGDETGNFSVTLDDVTLSANVELDLIGILDQSLGNVTLASVGIVGSLGPFTRRPIIVVN